MSDFHSLCLRRQTCRNYDSRPVERAKLVQCVETALLAPSACNSQPWSVVVVENPELAAEVAVCAQPNGANPFLSQVKSFFVVVEEHATLAPNLRKLIPSQSFAKGDVSGLVNYLCLAAADIGLGTTIIGLYNQDRMRELLGVPMEKSVSGLVAVGYPADETVRPKARKEFDQTVRFL
jgi:nitroreductase